jgi:hypothetical protein
VRDFDPLLQIPLALLLLFERRLRRRAAADQLTGVVKIVEPQDGKLRTTGRSDAGERK